MATTPSAISQQYKAALAEYLGTRSETGRERAYEIGRKALESGVGVIEMVGIHCRAVTEALQRAEVRESLDASIKTMGEFFAESMSPYEMTHRAYGEANAALRRLNAALEAEIKRIARELHDEAGQLLAAIYIKVDEISQGLPPEGAAKVSEIKPLLDQIEGELRRLTHELRPPVLDDLGLGLALRTLAERVSKRAKLSIDIEIGFNERMPDAYETALYRVVQEALTNIIRHARAKRAVVRLQRSNGEVICTIRDDGIGFDSTAELNGKPGRGLGLTGIHERIGSLGGRVKIIARPGHGTELRISLPKGNP